MKNLVSEENSFQMFHKYMVSKIYTRYHAFLKHQSFKNLHRRMKPSNSSKWRVLGSLEEFSIVLHRPQLLVYTICLFPKQPLFTLL